MAMKVAFVQQPISIQRAPATKGSLEVWMFEVARRLAKSCEVVVYSRRAPGQSRIEFHENVCYRRVSTPLDNRLMAAFARHPKLHRLPGFRDPRRPLFASYLAYLEYGLKVASDAKTQHCDVIHISNFSQIVPVVRAFNRGAAIVLHMECEWLSQLDRAMIERRLRRSDRVIGCSRYITGKVQNRFPWFAGRCRTVYNGVDVTCFTPGAERNIQANGTKRLLFVGRIWPDKGTHVLVEAFNQVAERAPDAELQLIGWKAGPPPEYVLKLSDDPHVLSLAPLCNANYFSDLERMISPKAAGRVSLLSPVSLAQLAQHYRDADVFVFPSVWNEPFGIPVIEAMSTAVPIIATQGGAFPEIVEQGKTGLLVPRSDPRALADAILYLLENEKLRRAMGQAGRERVLERFTWDAIAEDLLREYRDLRPQRGAASRLASEQGDSTTPAWQANHDQYRHSYI